MNGPNFKIDSVARRLCHTQINMKPTGLAAEPVKTSRRTEGDRSVQDFWKPVHEDFWKHSHHNREDEHNLPRHASDENVDDNLIKRKGGQKCGRGKGSKVPFDTCYVNKPTCLLDMTLFLRDMEESRGGQKMDELDSLDVDSIKLYKSRGLGKVVLLRSTDVSP
jgi:hypothetical protein